MTRAVPSHYDHKVDLTSVRPGMWATAMYLNLLDGGLFTTSGRVDVWPHAPWSTMIQTGLVGGSTLIEGWHGNDPVPHPCLLSVLQVRV